MTRTVTPRGTFAETYAAFEWRLPERYNLAWDVCDRHAGDPGKVALIHQDGADVVTYTFQQIQRRANQFANTMQALGLAQGDRVMVYLAQNPAAGIAHVGAWKAGMITLPTSVLFGVDGLEYRLNHSGAKVVITDSANLPKVIEARATAPGVQHVMVIDGPGGEGGALPFYATLAKASDQFETLALTPDAPAMINYTSGTTGWPKGALQGHRTMIGHMAGLETLNDFLPQEGDRIWSPADWAWLAGVANILMGGWFHGLPVLTFPMIGFDPELAIKMMGQHKVRNAFLTPTMLKLLRPHRALAPQYGVRLRSIISGSEAVGRDLLEEMNAMFGLSINEGFGQTEMNATLGNCASLGHYRVGSLGTPLPGHVAGIMDDAGNMLPDGQVGNLVFQAPDPVMLLEYWRDPEATARKFVNGWLVTGDLAERDEDGFYWFRGRADDVITSAGYRIGPTEIEDAIRRHPAVSMAAAIGVPDETRTEIIRAYVMLLPGHAPSDALAEEIRLSVRDRLARHEYPREIRFVQALPMTTTGKILRRSLRDEARAEREAKN
ncbi:MAG: AMP-binding protein [Hyphomonadaceae bacterium]